jgi:hypothetical protein
LAKSSKYENINLVPDPSKAEMDNLIANAHVNLIHSFYPQGFKLKLLYSLYGGRFCVCNPEVVEDTGLQGTCQVANSAQDFIMLITVAFDTHFSKEIIEERKRVLKDFSNQVQVQKLLRLLFE